MFNPIFVGFEHVHGTREMGQIERIRALNADIFTQPRFITVKFGPGRTCPVGHHGKERPFDREIECAACELLRDDVGDAQALPQCF